MDSFDFVDFEFEAHPSILHEDREYGSITFILTNLEDEKMSNELKTKWFKLWPQTGSPPMWDSVGIATC